MVTLKELENQRIKKIRSLNADEINNYADILMNEMCDILDIDNIVGADIEKAENDFAELVDKLDELYDLTGYNFKGKANQSYKTMITIQLVKYIVKDAESRNDLLSSVLSSLLMDFANLENYIGLLYQLLMDFKELSDAANVENVKLHFIDPLKKMIHETKEILDLHYKILDKSFYSDDKIKSEIHDVKVYIKTINESDNESDKMLVKHGFNSIYSGFIDVYETNAELKELFMQFKPDIDELISSADNVFKKYSAEKYDAASGISFTEFMKSEPKFNIDTGELIEP